MTAMRNLIILICAIICAVALTAGIVWFNLPEPVTSLHINSDIIRMESDMTKRLSITVNPEEATQYELISENEFVAVCEGDSVVAANEGETYVYAASLDGEVISNKVKVIVSNNIFKVAAKIISLANEAGFRSTEVTDGETDDESKDGKTEAVIENFENVEITPEKVSEITETTEPDVVAEPKSEQVPEISAGIEASAVITESAGETVYVTPTGGKFHLAGCSYAKNATPISKAQAIADGKTACKKCNP